MMSRMVKEVRPLLVPAGLMLAATTLSVVWSSGGHVLFNGAVQIALVSIYLGTPLLAASALGSEFQQRTLGLLIAQPVSRTRLWLEKWCALALVGGLTAALQAASLRVGAFEPGQLRSGLVLFVIAMICSAPLWTLIARSTIGGAAFSVSAALFLEFVAAFVRERLGGPGATVELFASTPALHALRVLYCVVTAGLGCWMFTRMEIAGTGYDQAMLVGRAVDGTRLPAVFRPRPQQPVLNLVRTELLLQRTTFEIAALFTVCWVAAVAFFSAQAFRFPVAEATFTVLLVVYLPLAIVLAGTISVGEDHSLGVHASQLTLPVRARTQWAVKVATAILVGSLLAIALPVALREWAVHTLGEQAGTILVQIRGGDTISLVAVIVLCFWAATLFGHTVRAAVASGVLLITLAGFGSLALMLGGRNDVGLALLTRAMVIWQLPPDFFFRPFRGASIGALLAPAVLVVFAVLVLALSFLAFKRLHVDRSTIARQVATVCLSMFVTVALASTYWSGAARMGWRSAPVQELNAALRALSSEGTRTPVVRSGDDLAPTGLLSPRTRQWLSGATIQVAQLPRRQWSPPSRFSVFEVTVRFPNGRVYIERYIDPSPENRSPR